MQFNTGREEEREFMTDGEEASTHCPIRHTLCMHGTNKWLIEYDCFPTLNDVIRGYQETLINFDLRILRLIRGAGFP